MELTQWIDERKDFFTDLSDQIWRLAETAFQEIQSAKVLADVLEEDGFDVERGVADIPTAFVASYGQGAPVIALLGEYDALPGISQEAVPERQPVEEDGNGHGCGHNLLGVGSLAAAMAVKAGIESGQVSGTVRYYGCPAEENGSGKAFMVTAGLFDDVDLSLTWHPGSFNCTFSVNMLSNIKARFKFHGQASHAAADPQNGRSALDAVELMNVGVNYLREHILPEARLHYVILNGGGKAPNVVPPFAESLYMVRAPRPDQLKPIYERVIDIARGAALMTGTRMETQVISGASNLLFNDTIVDVFQEVMEHIGGPNFDEDEMAFARTLAQTFPVGGGDAFTPFLGTNAKEVIKNAREELLLERILPAVKKEVALPGSSDVGDVSWVTPTGQIMTTCYAFGTPGHSWQQVAQVGMSIGHKGMLFAGKALALTALRFMKDPELMKQAQDEFTQRLQETPFVPLIPDGVKPPIIL